MALVDENSFGMNAKVLFSFVQGLKLKCILKANILYSVHPCLCWNVQAAPAGGAAPAKKGKSIEETYQKMV
jgi:hypothetical protein